MPLSRGSAASQADGSPGCTFSIRMPPIRLRLRYDTEYRGRPYYGEVAYVDHALGPLLDVAASSSRPTLVIVTADHGEGLGDHGELTHGLLAYESTLRVPLIITQLRSASQLRDTTAHGIVSSFPARHIDVVPIDAGCSTDCCTFRRSAVSRSCQVPARRPMPTLRRISKRCRRC